MTVYRLKTRDLEHNYKSHHGATAFGFEFLGSVLDNEINDSRNWFVEREGKVLNAYDFQSLRLNRETEEQIFARFARFSKKSLDTTNQKW